MTRVLWLSVTSGFYDKDCNATYNGGGWIGSLLQLLEESPSVEIGFAFLTPTHKMQKKVGNTTYYPIHAPKPSKLQKIRNYYGGDNKHINSVNLEDILDVIKEFQPDIIHLFGLENQMADILGSTSIPIVVHLQGILAPYNNAFWPVGFNKSSFIWPFSLNEWILRNGYIYAKKSINIRAQHEFGLFCKLQYAMGRTNWDKQCTSLMSPQAQYFHVDEVLRPVFYEHAGKWKHSEAPEIRIITTISNTVYKGLDTVLKTAKLLKDLCPVPFEWRIAGIDGNEKLVRFFERCLNIKSEDVNIKYLGTLSAEELCEEELQASMYVHPSYIDNSPNSLCEAQLLGVPCIATNVGGISSLVQHNKNGILVPANAPYELAYFIKEIATSKELADSISKEGFKTASARHDREKIRKEVLACYNTIIQQHQ